MAYWFFLLVPSLQECQSNLDYWLLTVFIQHKKEEGLFVSVGRGGGVIGVASFSSDSSVKDKRSHFTDLLSSFMY